MVHGANKADPGRPAYDNPVGDKGELVAGDNAKKPPVRKPSAKPQGHDSDAKLGRKPRKRGGPLPAGG